MESRITVAKIIVLTMILFFFISLGAFAFDLFLPVDPTTASILIYGHQSIFEREFSQLRSDFI
jgi:hypothetical protein